MLVNSRQDTAPKESNSDAKVSNLKTKSTRLSKGTPTFTTYLPEGRKSSDYGGWTRVSPAKSDPVYAYVDSIGNTTIRVSQQQLPDAFSGDVENKVKELADDFLATQQITTKDVVIYVGRNADGPESIIFYLGETLFSIKTDGKVSDDALVKYVESLTEQQ